MSSRPREERGPRRPLFEHGIQDREEFAHTRREGHLGHLARRAQARVKGADDGIKARGTQGPQVEDTAYGRPAAPDQAPAAVGATVPVEGRHAHQGGNLPAVQGAPLREGG